MIRGISEATVFVHNPLPPLTDEQIITKAGLDDTATARAGSPLSLLWQYGGGREQEHLSLSPGQRKLLRVSDAQAMLAELRERGLVSYDVEATEEVVEKACEAGIKAAIVFYSDRGAKGLTSIRKIHNLDRQAMEDSRHEHWTYYYNQAIADLLKAHLSDTKKPTSAKPTKKAS